VSAVVLPTEGDEVLKGGGREELLVK